MKLGNKYLTDGRYEEAILAFTKVIEIEPNNVDAMLGMGKVYIRIKKFDDAERILKDVIGIDANNIEARESLIEVYIKQNKVDLAEKILQQISSIDSNKDVKQLSENVIIAKEISSSKENYGTGLKLMIDHKYIEAIDFLKKVIPSDSDRYSDSLEKIKECISLYTADNLQKAKNEAQNKNYQSAINYLALLLKLDPNNSEALKLRSDYTEAIKKLQEEEKRKQEEEQSRKQEEELKKQQASQSITESQAREIALSYMLKIYSKSKLYSLGLKEREGKSYYTFKVAYDNGFTIHTETGYYIDKMSGKAYEYNISFDSLTPLP